MSETSPENQQPYRLLSDIEREQAAAVADAGEAPAEVDEQPAAPADAGEQPAAVAEVPEADPPA